MERDREGHDRRASAPRAVEMMSARRAFGAFCAPALATLAIVVVLSVEAWI